jgi:hypothetical protein
LSAHDKKELCRHRLKVTQILFCAITPRRLRHRVDIRARFDDFKYALAELIRDLLSQCIDAARIFFA